MLKELSLENDKDKEGVLLLVVGNYMYQDEYEDESEKEEENLLDNVDLFCKQNAAKSISDAAYTSFSTIIVGWRSVLYPDFGYATLGHELGHIISYNDRELNNPRLKNVKTCLVENKAGIDQYVEEDFADLFEVQMLKFLNEIPAKNHSCLLLNQEKGQYRDLKLSDEVEGSHSTSFYRLIAIGSSMKNLSPTCQSIKDSSSEGNTWKYCWGQ